MAGTCETNQEGLIPKFEDSDLSKYPFLTSESKIQLYLKVFSRTGVSVSDSDIENAYDINRENIQAQEGRNLNSDGYYMLNILSASLENSAKNIECREIGQNLFESLEDSSEDERRENYTAILKEYRSGAIYDIDFKGIGNFNNKRADDIINRTASMIVSYEKFLGFKLPDDFIAIVAGELLFQLQFEEKQGPGIDRVVDDLELKGLQSKLVVNLRKWFNLYLAGTTETLDFNPLPTNNEVTKDNDKYTINVDRNLSLETFPGQGYLVGLTLVCREGFSYHFRDGDDIKTVQVSEGQRLILGGGYSGPFSGFNQKDESYDDFMRNKKVDFLNRSLGLSRKVDTNNPLYRYYIKSQNGEITSIN